MMFSVTEGKKHFNSLVSSKDTTIVTKNGIPTAAVVPYEDYKKMMRSMREQQDLRSIEAAKLFLGTKKKQLAQVYSPLP